MRAWIVIRPFFILLFIGLLLLTFSSKPVIKLLASFLRSFTQPVIAAETTVARKGINLLTIIADLKNLAQDNARLTAENRQLEANLANLKEVEHENIILRQELGFVNDKNIEFIPSQLIGRTVGGASKELIINRGQSDGVNVGQVVMAQGYLIGLVSRVDQGQSQFTLLSNPRSLIPVLIQESRASGLLSGGIGGLTLTDLLIDAQVKVGDTVVTSGLGGGLVGGVPIGKVSNVTERPGDITKKATVLSPIDVSKLEMVFVRKGN